MDLGEKSDHLLEIRVGAHRKVVCISSRLQQILGELSFPYFSSTFRSESAAPCLDWLSHTQLPLSPTKSPFIKNRNTVRTREVFP